jgi:hypothetical protein
MKESNNPIPLIKEKFNELKLLIDDLKETKS